MEGKKPPAPLGWENLPLPKHCLFCNNRDKRSCRLKAMMLECWNLNPAERPTFNDIYDNLILLKQTLDWIGQKY